MDCFNQQTRTAINQKGSNDAFYKWFVLNYFNQRTDDLKAATPVHRITATTGPLFLANSLAEFVPTSGVLKVADALTAVQVPFELNMLPGSRHAKGYLDDVTTQMIAFLNTYLDTN